MNSEFYPIFLVLDECRIHSTIILISCTELVEKSASALNWRVESVVNFASFVAIWWFTGLFFKHEFSWWVVCVKAMTHIVMDR